MVDHADYGNGHSDTLSVQMEEHEETDQCQTKASGTKKARWPNLTIVYYKDNNCSGTNDTEITIMIIISILHPLFNDQPLADYTRHLNGKKIHHKNK